MLRVLGPGVFGLIVLCVWVYTLFDVITTDKRLIRTVPSKAAWLIAVGFFSVLGALAWFAFGRPLDRGLAPGSARSGPSRAWQRAGGPGQGQLPSSGGHRDWVDRVRDARETGDAGDDPPSSERAEDEESWERRLAEWEADLQRREAEADDRQASAEDPTDPDTPDPPHPEPGDAGKPR